MHLSHLGKTNVRDAHEHALLGPPLKGASEEPSIPPRMTNPVFLYEVSQPFDPRNRRDVQFRKDLQVFLNLTTPIGPPKHRESRNYHQAIDICDERYRPLRQEILEVGQKAATWILQYFVLNPDVTVSSPLHFASLLETWSEDPCDKN